MYDSPNYPASPEEVDAFVAGQRHGMLMATPLGEAPQASLLPFVREGDAIEVHCVQADATFQAARANPDVAFFVSDFLAFSPHHWVDPEQANRATLHFRAVQFRGVATTTTDPDEVAATMRRLVESYEPGASYRPIDAGDPVYGPRLRQLGAVRIAVREVQAKFKVGPYGPDSDKLAVAAALRARGEPGDARAADVIEARVRDSGA